MNDVRQLTPQPFFVLKMPRPKGSKRVGLDLLVENVPDVEEAKYALGDSVVHLATHEFLQDGKNKTFECLDLTSRHANLSWLEAEFKVPARSARSLIRQTRLYGELVEARDAAGGKRRHGHRLLEDGSMAPKILNVKVRGRDLHIINDKTKLLCCVRDLDDMTFLVQHLHTDLKALRDAADAADAKAEPAVVKAEPAGEGGKSSQDSHAAGEGGKSSQDSHAEAEPASPAGEGAADALRPDAKAEPATCQDVINRGIERLKRMSNCRSAYWDPCGCRFHVILDEEEGKTRKTYVPVHGAAKRIKTESVADLACLVGSAIALCFPQEPAAHGEAAEPDGEGEANADQGLDDAPSQATPPGRPDSDEHLGADKQGDQDHALPETQDSDEDLETVTKRQRL